MPFYNGAENASRRAHNFQFISGTHVRANFVSYLTRLKLKNIFKRIWNGMNGIEWGWAVFCDNKNNCRMTCIGTMDHSDLLI